MTYIKTTLCDNCGDTMDGNRQEGAFNVTQVMPVPQSLHFDFCSRICLSAWLSKPAPVESEAGS